MDGSPPLLPPERSLPVRDPDSNDRLQIRVVPYSPPRLSSDAPNDSSRPVSYIEDSPSLTSSPGPELGRVLGKPLSDGHQTPAVPIAPSPRSSDHGDGSVNAPISATETTPSSATSTTGSISSRRARRIINVHSDKTFSLLPLANSTSSRTDSTRSPRSLSNTFSSSYGRASSGLFTDDIPSSPPTSIYESQLAAGSPASEATCLPEQSPVSPSSSSPWNYRMTGGLRKVSTASTASRDSRRGTCDADVQEPPTKALSSARCDPTQRVAKALEELSPSELQESPASSTILARPLLSSSAPGSEAHCLPALTSKQSFQSTATDSTLSDKTNYKVYGHSSPVRHIPAEIESIPPSSSHSNYEILGESSPDPSMYEQPRPDTGESDVNYVIHQPGPSASTSSIATSIRRLRPQYSQESLIVPPLRPVKKRSLEIIGPYLSRSRESLRHGSLTSLSNVLTETATRALFSSPSFQIPGAFRTQSAGQSSMDTSRNHLAAAMIASRPHYWSSQLSTVMSESEPESEPASRSLSPASEIDRRSSGLASLHSRHMPSISSSLACIDHQPHPPIHSRDGSLEPPQPALFCRNSTREAHSGNQRLIRHHDEDGDGLADLAELHHRPSRTRLGPSLQNQSSDSNLRSASSSRANSFTVSAFPTWARFYYTRGEPRLLVPHPSSDSIRTQYNESQRSGSFLSRSPSVERIVKGIYNPRRRPRQPPPVPPKQPNVNKGAAPRTSSSRRSKQISEKSLPAIAPNPVLNIARTLKRQTSSLWSPHLHEDQRASGYSIWEPPSQVWSEESGLTGRRNIQVVLFLLGFICPFAWMVAALLPLPEVPPFYMAQRLRSTSHLDLGDEQRGSVSRIEERRYNSARWWRDLNRGMSVVGLLVIVATITLVVVGVKHQWGN